MKYLVKMVDFFQAHWLEVKRCAALLAELWPQLLALAKALAGTLKGGQRDDGRTE